MFYFPHSVYSYVSAWVRENLRKYALHLGIKSWASLQEGEQATRISAKTLAFLSNPLYSIHNVVHKALVLEWPAFFS